MKRHIGLWACSLLLCCGFLLTACGGGAEQETTPETEAATQGVTDVLETQPETQPETQAPDTEEITTEGEEVVIKEPIIPITFEEIKAAEDLEKFIAEVDYADGNHDNEAKEIGTITSPYFTMTVNGTAVDCYAVRTTYGAHSFAMIDAKDASFPLEVEIGVEGSFKKQIVLPTHYGVVAEPTDNGVRTTVEDYGNYTFVFDEDKTKAITLFIRADEAYEAPEGYEIIKVAPGVHNEQLAFTGEKQVLYFEAGVHHLKYNVNFKNNTEVYLERGAFICATMPDREEKPFLDPAWSGKTRWHALFQGSGVTNVRISGHGYIDMSRLDWHARSVVQFDSSSQITVDGITMNNSPEWTVYFTQCEDITVTDVMLFGYRQNSDGIAVVDSRNALVKDCFARSGDDLFEVKSMYGGCKIKIENIVFDNCNAWPDKARGLGIIAETARDMTNITFKDCSVGFASAEWMEDLAGLIIYTEGPAKITDVTFENIEIHDSAKYPVNITVGDNSKAQIEGVTFRNVTMSGSRKVRICNRSKVGGAINGITFENCVRNSKEITSQKVLGASVENVDMSKIFVVWEEK